MKTIKIFDTTLRDGAQDPRISFSVQDKLEIAKRLDQFGVDYIEGGWPGSNEKDSEFFKKIKEAKLNNSKIIAFGMTCQKNKKPEYDQQLEKLLSAETKIITIVGKSSKWQVENALGADLKENLRMIKETCQFLKNKKREVFFDAEHFFDGFKKNKNYSLQCLKAAIDGGASCVVLCDTNGGSLPWEVGKIVKEVKNNLNVTIGIHCHNDSEMAVANSLIAVEAGAEQVQGTINGYGERTGNANLCSLIPALKIKMGYKCKISNDSLKNLLSLSRFITEIANLDVYEKQPYVGLSVFRHKAGLHTSAINKNPTSYNHIDPALVGSSTSVIVSELSGKTNILIKAKEFGLELTEEEAKNILKKIETLEHQGFQFEGADGSLELLMSRCLQDYDFPFELVSREIVSRKFGKEKPIDFASIKIKIKNNIIENHANGEGPINALDNALRKSLLPIFPFFKNLKLVDYKVRALSGEKGTAKAVRILINFSDGQKEWVTIGCSTDSIEAGLQALIDGFEYAIMKNCAKL